MNERLNKIITLLIQEKKIEVTKLSELLNVSQVTIRKDLIQLESQGLLVREHGYARLNDSEDLNQRLAYEYETKQLIAKKACEMIEDGSTIMIESGSCCALLAREICNTKKDVTIITNSAFIADYIRKENKVKIILLGGDYQPKSQVMVGPLTRLCVQSFYVDQLFIGIDGFNVNVGFTGNDYLRSESVRDMANQAKNVIVLSQSNKFGKISNVKLIDVSKVKYFISDNFPIEEKTYLEEHHIKTISIKD